MCSWMMKWPEKEMESDKHVSNRMAAEPLAAVEDSIGGSEETAADHCSNVVTIFGALHISRLTQISAPVLQRSDQFNSSSTQNCLWRRVVVLLIFIIICVFSSSIISLTPLLY